MTETFVIKPGSEGLLVHDPDTGHTLPAEGARKPMSTYWLRRIACGDCVAVVVEEPKPRKAPKVEPIATPVAIEGTEERG